MNDARMPAPHLDPRLRALAERHPAPLVFATVSGAHLYGFPSPDSDFDLRGAHVLPLPKVLGLEVRDETIEISRLEEGLDMDIVSHDLRKFISLMLKRNGYVMEQLLSPLVVLGGAWHDELVSLAPGCLTRWHAHHYLGFAENQWGLLQREQPRRVKPLLYLFRVLLTGIHLMKSGRVEANLLRLQEEFRLPYLPDLIARKIGGAEQSVLADSELEGMDREFTRLRADLEQCRDASHLPPEPTPGTREALEDLLIRARMRLG